MGEPVVLLGAGALAREVLGWARHARREVAGFYAPGEPAAEVRGLPVFRTPATIPRRAGWLAAVGSPPLLRRLAEEAGTACGPAPALIHPTVVQGDEVEVGDGSVVCVNSALSCDIRVGQGCFVNGFTAIGHDARVGDHASIAVGVALSGRTVLEPGVTLGSGVVTNPGITIRRGAIVGSGAVVTKDLDAGVWAGVPAKLVRRLGAEETYA